MAKDLRFRKVGSQMAIRLQLDMEEKESGPFQVSHAIETLYPAAA